MLRKDFCKLAPPPAANVPMGYVIRFCHPGMSSSYYLCKIVDGQPVGCMKRSWQKKALVFRTIKAACVFVKELGSAYKCVIVPTYTAWNLHNRAAWEAGHRL